MTETAEKESVRLPYAAGKHILLRPIVAESKTPGGIALPQNVTIEQKTGEILSIGEKVRDLCEANDIGIGDRAVYLSHSAVTIKIDNEEYDVVEYSFVLAWLK